IDGTAPVDVSAVTRRGEWRMRPFRAVHGDHVSVAHDEERALATRSLQAGDDVRAIGVERENAHRDPFAIEHALEVIRGAAFVAGRVARVEPEERLKVLECFTLDVTPLRLERLGNSWPGGGERDDDREGDGWESHGQMIRREPSWGDTCADRHGPGVAGSGEMTHHGG